MSEREDLFGEFWDIIKTRSPEAFQVMHVSTLQALVDAALIRPGAAPTTGAPAPTCKGCDWAQPWIARPCDGCPDPGAWWAKRRAASMLPPAPVGEATTCAPCAACVASRDNGDDSGTCTCAPASPPTAPDHDPRCVCGRLTSEHPGGRIELDAGVICKLYVPAPALLGAPPAAPVTPPTCGTCGDWGRVDHMDPKSPLCPACGGGL